MNDDRTVSLGLTLLTIFACTNSDTLGLCTLSTWPLIWLAAKTWPGRSGKRNRLQPVHYIVGVTVWVIESPKITAVRVVFRWARAWRFQELQQALTWATIPHRSWRS